MSGTVYAGLTGGIAAKDWNQVTKTTELDPRQKCEKVIGSDVCSFEWKR